MPYFKRIGCWGLALSMLAALAGCAEGSTDTTPAAGTAAASTQTTAPTAEPEPTEDALAYFNAEGFPIVNEPITLEVMGCKASHQGEWEDLALFKHWTELTGIEFEFNTPSTDAYEEKKNLAFAGNDLPDVFIGGALTDSDVLNYGVGQGLLIPLNSLIEQYSPNIRKMYEEHPDWKRSATAVDGNIYTYTNDSVGFSLNRNSWLNIVWLANLGRTMPTTTDEFYEILKDFKEKDPNGNGDNEDEYPLSFASTTYPYMKSTLLNAFGILTDSFEIKDGEMIYAPITDNYKAYLKYMNQLWEEGLIDPDSFSQTEQQLYAKGVAGQIGCFAHIGDFTIVGMELYMQYQIMEPMTSSVNHTKISYYGNALNTGVAAITHTNPYPEATARLLDLCYDEEGALTVCYGVKDENWIYTEEGSCKFIIPEGLVEEEYRGGQITPDSGTTMPKYSQLAQDIITGGNYKANSPLGYNIQHQCDLYLNPYSVNPLPKLSFTQEEQESMSITGTDITTYFEQMEARFIVGDADIDAEWDNYVSTLKGIGVDSALEVYKTAYERWSSSD